MTKQEAYQLVYAAVGDLVLKRAGHVRMLEALSLLEPKDEVVEPKKEAKPEEEPTEEAPKA